MGLNHGTNIGNSKLKKEITYYIDPANPRSYPGSGTNIDSLNNAVTGSLVANAAFNNVNGGVINFDGVNDYIEIYNGTIPIADNILVPVSNKYSILSWIRVTGGSGNRQIFGTAMNNNSTQFALRVDGDNKLAFHLRYISGSPYYKTITGDAVLSNNVWYHVAMSWDGSNIQLYVNGSTDGSPVSNTTFFGQSGNWWASIGADKWRGNPPDSDFQGDIGPISIFNNKSLSAQEVKQNYNALKGRFGL